MDIIVNLINILSDKFNKLNDKMDDMNDKHIINMVLVKLDFHPNNYKIIKNDNNIFIKCHTYYINVFSDNSTDIEIKNKAIEYNQPMIYSHTKNSCIPPPQYYNEIINNIDSYKSRNPNLYLCIKYSDIIIDLETKNYKIIKAYFNIRKPTEDKYNLFDKIITNITNPSYYFIFNYDMNSINKSYSDITNNIYDLTKINLSFCNDDNNNINIDVIMPTITSLSDEIDTKPLVSNQIKINIINGGFI